MLLLVFGTIALHFGVLLEPGEDLEGDSTGLYPGTYTDAIVPAHLLAFAILTALLTWLSAQACPTERPGSGTLAAFAADFGRSTGRARKRSKPAGLPERIASQRSAP